MNQQPDTESTQLEFYSSNTGFWEQVGTYFRCRQLFRTHASRLLTSSAIQFLELRRTRTITIDFSVSASCNSSVLL